MNDELQGRMTTCEKEIRKLHVAVAGGDLSGEPGLLQNQLRMFNTLYDEREGLVPRLTSIERRELERMSWIKGAWFTWTLFGGILGFVISLLVKKFL